MAFALWAPFFWNPWMFLFPELTGTARHAPPPDDPEAKK